MSVHAFPKRRSSARGGCSPADARKRELTETISRKHLSGQAARCARDCTRTALSSEHSARRKSVVKTLDQRIEALKMLIQLNPEAEAMLRFDEKLLEMIERHARDSAFTRLPEANNDEWLPRSSHSTCAP